MEKQRLTLREWLAVLAAPTVLLVLAAVSMWHGHGDLW